MSQLTLNRAAKEERNKQNDTLMVSGGPIGLLDDVETRIRPGPSWHQREGPGRRAAFLINCSVPPTAEPPSSQEAELPSRASPVQGRLAKRSYAVQPLPGQSQPNRSPRGLGCPNLIRTLPALVHDQHDPEDVDSDGEDHAPDAGRYGLMTRVRPTVTPLEVMPSEYAQATICAEHDERERGRSSNFYAELSD